MRRILRVDHSIDLLHSRALLKTSVPYLCSTCRLQKAHFSTSPVPQAPESYTERIRQRIWGTSEPPGLQDPYGQPSNIDRKKAAKRASKAARPPSIQAPRPNPRPYKQATTWDDLEELRLPEPQPFHFNSFVPADVITDGDEITTCLHRAMVEVFACSQAGRPLSDVWSMEPIVDQTHKIQIKPLERGVDLLFSEDMTRKQLLESLSPKVITGSEDSIGELPKETASDEDFAKTQQVERENLIQTTDPEEASIYASPADMGKGVAETQSDVDAVDVAPLSYYDVVKSWDSSWLQISLYDPVIKFAVLKRTMQLTGIRIKDAEIRGVNTAWSLLKLLIQPPKPAKLVETLVENENLMTLPNISVFAKKVTKIDKEIQVGRWKLIEKELRTRGLPLTHRG